MFSIEGLDIYLERFVAYRLFSYWLPLPFGLLGLALPAKLLGRLVPGSHNVYAHSVAENVPPFLLERWSHGEFWHLKWFLGLLAVAIWMLTAFLPALAWATVLAIATWPLFLAARAK